LRAGGVKEGSLSARGFIGQRPEPICGEREQEVAPDRSVLAPMYVKQGERLYTSKRRNRTGGLMRSQAIPTRAAVGTGTIWRMVAAVERRVARMTSRRRRGDAFQRDELATPWTAGISRGLTLFVGDPRTTPRREVERKG
jgi:hypothetical protein